MKRTQLTDRYVQAIKAPAEGRVLHGDSLVPGLAVSATATGAKTYVLYTRYPRTSAPARRALGGVGAISLAEAREKARGWLALIARGIDPKDQEERERAARDSVRAHTFAAVAEDYLRLVQGAHPADVERVRGVRLPPRPGAKRKAEEVARDVRNQLLPMWGTRPIAEIGRPDVVRMVDVFVERGSKGQARNVLGYARQIFDWAVERGCYGIEHSPCATIRPKRLLGAKPVGQRTLSDEELAALWRATSGSLALPTPHSRARGAQRSEKGAALAYPIGPMVRLLMLTGGRLGEVNDASWSEFARLDDEERSLWTIPAERFKSGSTHLVPLGPAAVALLADLPRHAGGDYVFSYTGQAPTNGHSRAKEAIDRAMARELGREPDPWTLHDIRRTVRTRLGGLGVAEVVAEMLIGHSKTGLVRVYDRHTYLDERRDALASWERLLLSIAEPPQTAAPVEPAPSNVVQLRPAVSA